MKKVFVGCLAAILSIALLLTVLFFIYKSFTINDLKNKSSQTDKIWISFIDKENKKNRNITELLKSYSFKNSDSLKFYLNNKSDINNSLKCDENFVFNEYLLNKYFLVTFEPYIKDKDLLLENKEKFNMILNIIDEQNIIISDYDANVRDFNNFIGMFPNFIIAKSNGFKMKKYFKIKFGVPNEDPKKARLETIEWIKQIEKEQGL